MQFRVLATSTSALLLSLAVSAAAQTPNISTLDYGGSRAATGFGHMQSVVSNQYGYFAAYVHESDADLLAATWRLVHSTNGGLTFSTLYQATHGGPAPVIETDRDGNIYLIHSDANTNNAYFMRFLATNSYTSPTTLTLPAGAAQKYSAVIDESRGQMYYAATNFVPSPPVANNLSTDTVYFFTIPLSGASYSRVRLTLPRIGAANGADPAFIIDAHYPHLYLDEHEHLYVAWTNLISKFNNQGGLASNNYHSIHFMRSRDGGANWENLTGTSIALPVVPDYTGPTHEVNVGAGPDIDRDASPWLWNIIVKQGKAHFWYRASSFAVPAPMHYVRFDTVSGAREIDTEPWGTGSYAINALHGDCSTRRERLDGTIWCISTTTDGDGDQNNDNDSLVVVVTTDNGATWQDHGATGPVWSCSECHFGISTARQIDEGSRMLGSYIQFPEVNPVTHTRMLKFFSVDVPTPSGVNFAPAAVTTSAADSLYPAGKATDGNLASQWIASTSVSPANNNAWIQLDLGGVKEVRYLRWTGAVGSPHPAHSPSHYTITASNDGVNWRTIANRAYGSAVTSGNEPIFSNARYLRLTTTKVNDGTGWALSFFEFYAVGLEPPATLPLSTAGSAASAFAPGYPVSNATDNNLATLWAASTSVHPSNNSAWYYLDLGSVQPITRLKWWGGQWVPHPVQSPSDYSIQVSNDALNWRTLRSRTNPVGVINGNELIAATARYVRLITTKVNDGTGWSLGFFQFWVED